MYRSSNIVLLTIAPLLIGAVGVATVYLSESSRVRGIASAEMRERSRVVEIFLQAKLNNTAWALLTLADGEAMAEFIAGMGGSDNGGKEGLLAEARGMARLSRDVDQVCVLSGAGRELLRVNAGGAVVAEEELQDKSARSYFASGQELEPGEVMLTEFDLNVERGQVEEPFRPVVRLMTPVMRANGEPFGLAVVNLNLKRFFESLAGAYPREEFAVEMVDSRGYWERATDPDLEWGEQIEARVDETLAKKNPALWEEMLESPDGEMIVEGDLYVWIRATFAGPSESGGGGRPNLVEQEDFHVILSCLPSEEMHALLLPIRALSGGTVVVMALAGTVLLTALRGRHRERVADGEKLRLSEERLLGILASAPISLWEEDWSTVMEDLDQLRSEGVTDLWRYLELHPEFAEIELAKVGILGVNDEAVRVFEAEGPEDLTGVRGAIYRGAVDGTGFGRELLALWDGESACSVELSLKTLKGRAIETVMRVRFPEPGSGSSQVLAGLIDVTEQNAVRRERDQVVAMNAALVNVLDDAVYVIDPEAMRFLDANEAAMTSIGRSAEELFKIGPHDIKPELTRDEVQAVLRRAVTDGSIQTIRTKHQRADGGVFPVEVVVNRFRSGGQWLVVAAARDMTDRQAYETDLIRANERLASSNRELEQFAYVASHDLQEPLRMVASFSQLLSKKYGDQLDEQAQRWIAFSVDGASRMQKLINDLLEFSRLTTRGREHEPVDAAAMLNAGLANLTQAVEESGAEIERADLPWVVGDGPQLALLFQNLLSNALKYRGETPPRVCIGAGPATGADAKNAAGAPMWEFRVTDNGIGIQPKYREQVFVIFQRLHTREEYAGTGIGLAMCRKIVETHGGRIWIETGDDGEGTRISFTLPFFKSPAES